MKNITVFEAMEIVSITDVNLELNQKMLKVIEIFNLIKHTEERIEAHGKLDKQWSRLGVSIMHDRVEFEKHTDSLKNIKKDYYNSLESLQLQVEKEKHTAGYFKQ